MTTTPGWLVKRTPKSKHIKEMHGLLGDDTIHTVCESAKCPNIGECYSNKTVTFLILGNACTRNCSFCAVNHGKPLPLDENEPVKVAEAAKKLGLKYIVVTSVTRDDLKDGGAGQFARTIEEIRSKVQGARCEVLVPDFRGDKNALKKVIDARPDVLNHNMETVKRLYKDVRPQGEYERSLELLRTSKELCPSLYTKSGLMLGLGETGDEVVSLMKDLFEAGCDILTVGQYIRPSKDQVKIKEYIHPSKFEEYESIGKRMGFKKVSAGPFVRSSYKAGEINV
jgi:lipoic acid synthetase